MIHQPSSLFIAALQAEVRLHRAYARLTAHIAAADYGAHARRLIDAASTLGDLDRALLDEVVLVECDDYGSFSYALAHEGFDPCCGPDTLEAVVEAIISGECGQ